MKTVLFLILVSSLAFGQTLFTETFGNDKPTPTGSYSMFDYDSTEHSNSGSDSLGNNLSTDGDGDDASFFGWSNGPHVYDSLKSGNPLKSSGWSLMFNNSSGHFSRANNTTGHHEFRTGDGAVAAVFFNDGTSTTQGISGKGGNNATSNIGYELFKENSNFRVRVSDGSGTFVLYTSDAMLSGWNIAVLDWDRSDGIRLYLNGAAVDSNIAANSVDITNKGWFWYLGRDGGNSNNFDSRKALDVFWNVSLGKIACLEFGFLPSNWVSLNGKVSRERSGDTWLFEQTFSDTIGVPVGTAGSLSSWGNFRLAVKAKSSASNKTLRAWIGTRSTVKSTNVTQVVTASFVNYTLNMGDGYSVLATDSLWFATNSLTDEVVIDNAVLSINSSSESGSSGTRFSSWDKW